MFGAVAGEGGEYVTQEVADLVYSQLVVIDDLMRPIPDLAATVPTLDNGEAVMVGDGADQHLETTFHLRQDAKWSDGTPFTSEDVVFSWKLSLNPTWPAQAGNDIETKYADVVAISRNPQTFSSHRGATFIEDQNEDDLTAMQQMMVNMDPPQHVRFRNLVKRAFLPKVIESQEPKIRQVVTDILDEVLPRGECDFVEDVAAVLPLEAICELVGVREQDRRQIFEWGNAMTGIDDPNVGDMDAGMAASAEMITYADGLANVKALASCFDAPPCG